MKFAGFDLDKVFEEDVARRKAAAEEAERIKQRQELEARVQGRRKKAEPTPPADPAPTSAVAAVSYADLLWQPKAYRETGQTDKKLLTYDESLSHLRSEGYDRHARPAEVMSLFCAGLEGKLSAAEKEIAADMLTSYGEWVSLAWERKGNTLITYLDPEGLVWMKNKYVKDNFRFTEQKEFDITGKASATSIDLRDFEEALVQYHYGCSFADLPEEMREGEKRAQLYLPADGRARPVGRGSFGGFGFYCNFNRRAARGVVQLRVKNGSLTGNGGTSP